MSAPPTVALIVSTFEQPDYLRRVLAAVSRQSRPPDEMFLADDGSGAETKEVFSRWAAQQFFPPAMSGRRTKVFAKHTS